jgi:hypothetical protein
MVGLSAGMTVTAEAQDPRRAQMGATVGSQISLTIATVDGTPITKAAVARVYRESLAPYRRSGGTDLFTLKALRLEQRAVQVLIDKEIGLREARRLRIDVTLAEVRGRLAALPALQENGRYIGESRTLDRLAPHRPELPREALLEDFRRDMVIERLEAHVGRGVPDGPQRTKRYEAYIEGARLGARVTIDPTVLEDVVRELR